MPCWNARLNVRQYIDEMEDVECLTDEMVHQVAGKILAAIKRFMEAEGAGMDGLDAFRDTFETLTAAGGSTGNELVEEFNCAMNDFYDWGDENRVWLGDV